MGVPKFFRYISERYPCLSEVVREYQIPEFDNLYLDMNGIIHMCSHPDDENVHFRITEEQIFKDIFHYIEVLFRMIKPQKLFFMAVDGVAPRAKMNQQRGRRFRSAKDAEKKENEAKKKGEILPEEARFDSNCITPGTPFMTRLHEQLKYFVVDKISSDSLWQSCTVILSGHETPGEGEHKIMDYIRFMRAQPGYDPNTRHCLYGLDADLIMLGLCTHEPHFSLLREEVKFGRKSTKRVSVPEEITFYLLHLSLMREYLELEFASLKDSLKNVEFDMEKIIDDWVLMGFLVGNDFIPHLPNLHITSGALPFLYKAYMDVLPSLDGYINENGQLNLERFEKFMQSLSSFDLAHFEEVRDDLLYMEAKTGRKQTAHSKVSCDPAEISIDQPEGEPTARTQRDTGLAALIQAADEFAELSLEEEEELENESDPSEDEAFTNYKREYYQNKLEFSKVTHEVMRAQAEGYVRAIQWNLNYYYNGCCSWSWYYPHHYAPYISDIKGFSKFDLKYDLGKPFLPFEQLLAVLPPASKDLLPDCYHNLMTKKSSIIKKFYPEDFETDLNGKKQDWEAVVLVPFIDENLLLEAMSQFNDCLTDEEVARNTHGPMLIYKYTPLEQECYAAPEYFPPVKENHAEVTEMFYDDIIIPKEKLIKGAYPGALMNVYYPGFPTMKHLKYKAELTISQIKVFDYASRGENMVISIIPSDKITSGEMIPVDLLDTGVFVKWPHLTEAKVVAISNSKRKYVSMGQGQYNVIDQDARSFNTEIDGITEFYHRRLGIIVGDTKVLVYVQTLMGKKYTVSNDGKLLLEKQFAPNTSCYPLQAIVYNIKAFEGNEVLKKELGHIFPRNAVCFTLTNPYYGSTGIVQENLFKKNGRIKITVTVQDEPDFKSVEEYRNKIKSSYRTLYSVASQLAISNNMFSRITGSIFVKVPDIEGTSKNFNIGLDLKMNKKNLETPGYTKKIGSIWHYSDKAADLVRQYCEYFPEVFEYFSSDSSFDDVNPEAIFTEDWEPKLAELKLWLKSLPTYRMTRQLCGSSVMEPEVVKEIENTVNSFRTNKVKNVTMQIKPNFLYRPELQSGTLLPDPKMNVRLLDRVVNVRSGYSVPFGLKGTVIAIQESSTKSDRDTMYDILFDTPFKDGMKMNCSDERVYKLPKYSFINITYGQRLMEQKTGKPDDVIAASRNTSNNQYSNQSAQSQQTSYGYSNQQFGQQHSAFAQFSSFSYNKQLQDQQGTVVGLKNNYPQISQNHSHKQYDSPNKFDGSNGQNERLNDFQPYFKPFLNSNQSHTNNPFMKYYNQKDKGPFFTDKKDAFHGNGTSSNMQKQEQKNQSKNLEGNWRTRTVSNVESPSSASHANDKRQHANSDFLKKILNINENYNQQRGEDKAHSSQNTNVNRCEPIPQDVSIATTDSTEKKSDENSTTLSFQQLSQVANAPASIRLLTYYQSNGLGLPRYQYFNSVDGVQAQITLSDGQLIIGKPAKTREEASENVAADVLDLFIKNKKPVNKTKKQDFPAPPETWVQPEMNTHSRKEHGNNRKTDTSAVLNNSFVPLQAVKSHINKTNNDSSKDTKRNIENPEDSDRKTGSTKASGTNRIPHNKPKRERKTRIAAKLFNKN